MCASLSSSWWGGSYKSKLGKLKYRCECECESIDGLASIRKTVVIEASNSQESRSSSKPSGLLIGDEDSSLWRPKLSYIGGGDGRVEMGEVALEVALVRASGDEPPEM